MIEPVELPTVALVAFEGDLEPHEWAQFRDGIVDAATVGITEVVLDLSGVTFFDSHSIRGLLGARSILLDRGVTIAFGPVSPLVRRIIEVTKLDQGIPSYPAAP